MEQHSNYGSNLTLSPFRIPPQEISGDQPDTNSPYSAASPRARSQSSVF